MSVKPVMSLIKVNSNVLFSPSIKQVLLNKACFLLRFKPQVQVLSSVLMRLNNLPYLLRIKQISKFNIFFYFKQNSFSFNSNFNVIDSQFNIQILNWKTKRCVFCLVRNRNFLAILFHLLIAWHPNPTNL